MKRSFTFLIAIAILFATSNKSFSQCLTGGSFTTSSTYTFDVNTQGFSGDFGWVSAGSGELESTPVSAGQTKILTTSTLFLPNSATTIAWGFDLGGTANVTNYTVEALYSTGSVPVCSGGALSTIGGSLVFAAVAPSEIIGNSFQLRITFTSTATGSKVLTIDNFKSNANSSAITLPVTFSYFSIGAAPGGIKLTWLVASEINVNRYEIERSSNGKTFSKIGSVSASGLTTYTYLDAAYSTGSNYYRLKAVDNDGKYKYSSISLLKVGKNTLLSTLKLYPVPANNQLTLLHDAATVLSSINILSIDGKIIKTVLPTVGNTETTINISSLKPGLYIVRYNVDGGSATVKLIKQ